MHVIYTHIHTNNTHINIYTYIQSQYVQTDLDQHLLEARLGVDEREAQPVVPRLAVPVVLFLECVLVCGGVSCVYVGGCEACTNHT